MIYNSLSPQDSICGNSAFNIYIIHTQTKKYSGTGGIMSSNLQPPVTFIIKIKKFLSKVAVFNLSKCLLISKMRSEILFIVGHKELWTRSIWNYTQNTSTNKCSCSGLIQHLSSFAFCNLYLGKIMFWTSAETKWIRTLGGGWI